MLRSLLFVLLLPSAQATCARVLPLIRDGLFADYSRKCTCRYEGSTGGGNATASCETCDFCSGDVCGQGTNEAMYLLESDDGIGGTVTECFAYSEGVNGTLCVEQTLLTTECSVTVDGTACTSCERQLCADGETTKPVADCTNFPGGQVIDLCQESVTIADAMSSFVAFDATFQDEAIGVHVCKSGATRLTSGLMAVAGMVALWVLV